MAVHAHRIAVAVRAEREAFSARERAEATARADGFRVEAWRHAMDLLEADPEAIAALERHTSVLLMAVRASIAIDDVRLFDSTSDHSNEVRARRIHDEGWHAAVLDLPADGGGYARPDDRAQWVAGWHAFQKTLDAFNAAEAGANMGALSSDHPGENLTAQSASEAA